MKLTVLVFLAIYATIVLFNAVLGFKIRIIPVPNLIWTVVWTLFVYIFGYLFYSTGNLYALAGVAAGLFGYSSVALRNAQAMGQMPKLKHHLIRLGIHVAFLLLLYFA